MSPDDEALLEELRVQRLFTRYFDRVDANDPVGAAGCATEDIAFEIMIGERRHGRDRFARGLGRVLDGYSAASHHVSNYAIHFYADRSTASVFAYVYAFHRLRSTGEPWHLWARLDDEVRRVGGEWLISRHVVLGIDAQPVRDGVPADWYSPHPGRLTR